MKPRTTVKLPDGNGATMLFNVAPVEVDGYLVKLSCAEEGKGHLIRWVRRSELQNHINAQDAEEGELFGPDVIEEINRIPSFGTINTPQGWADALRGWAVTGRAHLSSEGMLEIANYLEKLK